ncbi:hypothetical protein CR513_46228, partial [Mucuna pruriens]
MHLMVWSCKCGRKKWRVWNSMMRWLVKEKRTVGHCSRAWEEKAESQSRYKLGRQTGLDSQRACHLAPYPRHKINHLPHLA